MLAESERLLGFSMSVGTGNVPCPELFRREGASSCAVLRGAPLGRFLAGNETVRPFGRGKREKKMRMKFFFIKKYSPFLESMGKCRNCEGVDKRSGKVEFER